MLGEQVGRVLGAKHLAEFKFFPPQALLNPEAVALQVPELAEPLPRSSSHGCRTVGPNPDRQLEPRVAAESLLAEAHAGATDDAVEFCLPTTQG